MILQKIAGGSDENGKLKVCRLKALVLLLVLIFLQKLNGMKINNCL